MTMLIILLVIGSWVFWFRVGQNNPSLTAVNKLIAAGKAVVDATGKIISKIKK